MLELLFIAYILLLFVFPLPALAILLGLLTAWGLHRKYDLAKNQPPAGSGVLRLHAIACSLNLAASVAVGLGLAVLVNAIIFDFIYLFLFNFIFCFLVALRWFDFTHRIYRRAIFKLKPPLRSMTGDKCFVTLTGMREGSGFGPGLSPAFIDAGFLVADDSRTVFAGVFTDLVFDAATVTRVEKKSSDRIWIVAGGETAAGVDADAFLIALKDQLYPFQSRLRRDGFVRRLNLLGTPPLIAEPAATSSAVPAE